MRNGKKNEDFYYDKDGFAHPVKPKPSKFGYDRKADAEKQSGHQQFANKSYTEDSYDSEDYSSDDSQESMEYAHYARDKSAKPVTSRRGETYDRRPSLYSASDYTSNESSDDYGYYDRRDHHDHFYRNDLPRYEEAPQSRASFEHHLPRESASPYNRAVLLNLMTTAEEISPLIEASTEEAWIASEHGESPTEEAALASNLMAHEDMDLLYKEV